MEVVIQFIIERNRSTRGKLVLHANFMFIVDSISGSSNLNFNTNSIYVVYSSCGDINLNFDTSFKPTLWLTYRDFNFNLNTNWIYNIQSASGFHLRSLTLTWPWPTIEVQSPKDQLFVPTPLQKKSYCLKIIQGLPSIFVRFFEQINWYEHNFDVQKLYSVSIKYSIGWAELVIVIISRCFQLT